jgi:hypothetical protein
VKVFWEKAIVASGGGGLLVEAQEAGGQQAQAGRLSFGVGAKGVPKSSNGYVIGLRRSWKALLGFERIRLGVFLHSCDSCLLTLGRRRG